MKKHWMIVLALLVFATGCKEEVEDPTTSARLEKIRAAVEEANNAPKQSVRRPEANHLPQTQPEDVGGESDEEVKPEDSIQAKDGEKNDEKVGDPEVTGKTESSGKMIAKTVLNEAIATAKSENKVVFVHFTADW